MCLGTRLIEVGRESIVNEKIMAFSSIYNQFAMEENVPSE